MYQTLNAGTPTMAAIAMIEGIFWDIPGQERIGDDFKVIRIIAEVVDELRDSLIVEAEKGATDYTAACQG
jgi:hypothetical protein